MYGQTNEDHPEFRREYSKPYVAAFPDLVHALCHEREMHAPPPSVALGRHSIRDLELDWNLHRVIHTGNRACSGETRAA